VVVASRGLEKHLFNSALLMVQVWYDRLTGCAEEDAHTLCLYFQVMSCIQDQQKWFVDKIFLLCLGPNTSYSGNEFCAANFPFRYSNLFQQRPLSSSIGFLLSGIDVFAPALADLEYNSSLESNSFVSKSHPNQLKKHLLSLISYSIMDTFTIRASTSAFSDDTLSVIDWPAVLLDPNRSVYS
jgi:hypothetical protein